jgi:two-component system OmpR family response regulator
MQNLLIIDDEDIIINLLHDYFSHLGYSVATAKDGSEGIDLFNASPNFDLVITDINMPGIDGNAVAKSIRLAQRTKVPIVGMSGYNDEADSELFDFMLAKPFNLKELTAVVNTIESNDEAHLTQSTGG